MLFNSYLFLFAFLPIVLLGFYISSRYFKPYTVYWLATCSLFFYGWWSPKFLFLLIVSICLNYMISQKIVLATNESKKTYLITGIAVNLAALIYYKYAVFALENINLLWSSNLHLENIILPLGISFFTFTQIAYLVDTFRGETAKTHFKDYCLFVSYFPHLIAGPIIHHREIIPQFKRFYQPIQRPLLRYFLIGLTLFSIGLFKKVCIADTLAPFANSVFDTTAKNYDLSFIDAWFGALCYTFQLYFDFSGYSDMAIGLSYMLGIKLPINFFSPYKATNIISFWRRWHITLSRFFRDYVYIPLGGNRKGQLLKFTNLFVVMLLVGFWHGAGWTFLLWGGFHGTLLLLNHGWLCLKEKYLPKISTLLPKKIFHVMLHKYNQHLWSRLSQLFTFALVVLGWVLFRAKTFAIAKNFYQGMFLQHRFFHGSLSFIFKLNYVFVSLLLIACFIICTLMPNTTELMKGTNATLDGMKYYSLNTHPKTHLKWRFRPAYAIPLGIMMYFCLTTMSQAITQFLYFNF